MCIRDSIYTVTTMSNLSIVDFTHAKAIKYTPNLQKENIYKQILYVKLSTLNINWHILKSTLYWFCDGLSSTNMTVNFTLVVLIKLLGFCVHEIN